MTDTTQPGDDSAALIDPSARALLMEMTTFAGTLVSGDYLASRAAALLGIPVPQYPVIRIVDLVADTMDHAQLQALGQQQKGAATEEGRFDRVTPQADGSFRHSYRGAPVAGPGCAPAPEGLVLSPGDETATRHLFEEQMRVDGVTCFKRTPLGRYDNMVLEWTWLGWRAAVRTGAAS